ncbi:nicotinamide riboside transporter PnuC [Aestuariibacter salexigens]|uniref:nicotinamide riboside transporter PnuC n=1 Tax=Aestuariibacter salexigens TaxID=226010 RepID=UPI000413FBBC|nr:nicotinamide riboside transporter PnuC [Aestuariibacter salexigens]
MNLFEQIWQQFAGQSLLELMAVILALMYVWLAARKNMLCWLCAFVSSTIFAMLFWQYGLPFQSALNVYYVVMAVYGFWQWQRRNSEETFTRRLSWRLHGLVIIVLACAAWLVGTLAAPFFTEQWIMLDAAITVFSVFTTVLVAHRVWENWLYWLVINSAAVWLYAQTGLYLTAMLFVCYIGFSVYGLIHWRQDIRES